jgi:uncharacterized membrane protein
MNVLGYDWPRLHAALNELPAALLFVSVLFDLAAAVTKRESLRATALWTLWAGVVGGWAAVVAGLQAEDVIEHGEAVHELMETHERLALITMSIFTVVLGYQLLRRAHLSEIERVVVRVLSVAGFVGIIWTGRIGGKMTFEHAAGVPTTALQAEIGARAADHHHHHHDGDAADDDHAADHDSEPPTHP